MNSILLVYLIMGFCYLLLIVMDRLFGLRQYIRETSVYDKVVAEIDYLIKKLLRRWIIFYNILYEKILVLDKSDFINACSWIALMVLIGLMVVVIGYGF